MSDTSKAEPRGPRVLGHAAEADGIEEYDNPLPTWWVGLIVVTVIYGIVYAFDYHFLSHRSLASEYAEEVAAAEQRWPGGGGPTTVDTSPEAVAKGRTVYEANCVACHAADMKGGVGPDLTDSTWIHGGTLPEIQKTVAEGVPAKGMLAWGPILGPEAVGRVSAFVHAQGGGQ